MYHFVCPAKYRRVIITDEVAQTLGEICAGIEVRYDWIKFLEIGADKDHVHFLIRSTPRHSPNEIIKTVKSITAHRIYAEHPKVTKKLWGGELGTDGYFVSTVGQNTDEETIAQYVREQGIQEYEEYRQLKVF